jgi:transcriptional regulator with GAF, ATPase, and Fis domain
MSPTEHSTSLEGLPPSELADNFAETARTLFSAGTVTDTLSRVVELAIATVEGCDFAGLFLIEGGEITTPIHADPIVDEMHAAQHLNGEGPCLDAIAQRIMLYADDLALDARWPRFGPQASVLGVRSVLALPLAAEGCVGALNLYARYPAAFGVHDRARGVILASLASLAISAALSHEDWDRRTEHLQAALVTREVIGQAQGILMERERISAAQAFDILRRASQHLNRKLRDVAQDLVDTGTRPETGTPRPQ